MAQPITLSHLHVANALRNEAWDPHNKLDLTFKGLELAGEVGEACNVIKKLTREQLDMAGTRDTVDHLAEELADVVICASLVANKAGIDLSAAVAAKFNATSDKLNFNVRLVSPVTL